MSLVQVNADPTFEVFQQLERTKFLSSAISCGSFKASFESKGKTPQSVLELYPNVSIKVEEKNSDGQVETYALKFFRGMRLDTRDKTFENAHFLNQLAPTYTLESLGVRKLSILHDSMRDYQEFPYVKYKMFGQHIQALICDKATKIDFKGLQKIVLQCLDFYQILQKEGLVLCNINRWNTFVDSEYNIKFASHEFLGDQGKLGSKASTNAFYRSPFEYLGAYHESVTPIAIASIFYYLITRKELFAFEHDNNDTYEIRVARHLNRVSKFCGPLPEHLVLKLLTKDKYKNLFHKNLETGKVMLKPVADRYINYEESSMDSFIQERIRFGLSESNYFENVPSEAEEISKGFFTLIKGLTNLEHTMSAQEALSLPFIQKFMVSTPIRSAESSPYAKYSLEDKPHIRVTNALHRNHPRLRSYLKEDSMLPTAYRFRTVLGAGTYGVVLKCGLKGADKVNDFALKILFPKESREAYEKSCSKDLKCIEELNKCSPSTTLPLLTVNGEKSFEYNGLRGYFLPLSGASLSNYINKGTRYPFTDVIHFLAQAINHYQNLCAKGVVQVDLTPRNILIEGDLKTPNTLKFIDPAGLYQEGTEINSRCITPWMYTSPTFHTNKFNRSEMAFSLGCAVYTMVTRKPLFTCSTGGPEEPKLTAALRHLNSIKEVFGDLRDAFIKELDSQIQANLFTFSQETGYTLKSSSSTPSNTPPPPPTYSQKMNNIREALNHDSLSFTFTHEIENHEEVAKELIDVIGSLLYWYKPITAEGVKTFDLVKRFPEIFALHESSK